VSTLLHFPGQDQVEKPTGSGSKRLFGASGSFARYWYSAPVHFDEREQPGKELYRRRRTPADMQIYRYDR
jgi:hypothetical protein